ncbi:GDP-mannose-dependent alpha-(1-6)-phosphatidylinositol monomannoside mannosyltransferase [Thiorhodovibrio winogradskyi]|uniref:GDP-mannose-dependent alpha-(1-6)-phosphatidylinositol monomannoside mannosyltransferase n=1 Tax=Thiorhodovibrio winogradskyi TaxID=77007 RepID=A0ABZ0S4Z0_9GAMM|nr:glycosyltransferase family 4 protein [Thiorhodovibrio winogradskyi]
MNILVTASHTPFIHGGASYLAQGLVAALRAAGHQVELMGFPFSFQPERDIHRLMDFCAGLDLSAPNGQPVERVISLQFPGYAVAHPHHTLWLIHQHRSVYELYDPNTATPEQSKLREAVIAFDQRYLARIPARFTISQRVADRLQDYSGISARGLLHPPAYAEGYYNAEPQPYLFCPSRLEQLKRQDLLIEAARHLRSPLVILIAGTGGQLSRYQQLIDQYGLHRRVRLLGSVSEAEKIALYANALAVFFAPFDEDYGYITLEAMLAAKPVITCTDSGGPLEFVLPDETGRVVPPDPQAIAAAIDHLHADRQAAIALGRAGRARYEALQLSWPRTVETLLGV